MRGGEHQSRNSSTSHSVRLDFEMDHPLRTLLYELVIEPVLGILQRVLDFVI
jgi:hypothetical protein